MQARTKLAVAGLAATLLMSLAVSNATAARLSVSNQNFRIVWSPLTFFGEGGLINPRVECPVTLEGSFHYATIAKGPGDLIGYVTKAAVNNAACRGGLVTILTETLPWHVTYDSFTGTLPRITGIVLLLHTTAFLVEIGSRTSCLYAENGVQRARGTALREAGGAITGLEAVRTIRLPLIRGTFGCPPEGGFEGTGEVTLLGTTSRIIVTLI